MAKSFNSKFNQALLGRVSGSQFNCGPHVLLHHLLSYVTDPDHDPKHLQSTPYLKLLESFRAGLVNILSQSQEPIWHTAQTSLLAALNESDEFLESGAKTDTHIKQLLKQCRCLRKDLKTLTLKSWQSQSHDYQESITSLLEAIYATLKQIPDTYEVENPDKFKSIILTPLKKGIASINTLEPLELKPAFLKKPIDPYNPSANTNTLEWSHIQKMALECPPYILEKIFGNSVKQFICVTLQDTLDPKIEDFQTRLFESQIRMYLSTEVKARLQPQFQFIKETVENPKKTLNSFNKLLQKLDPKVIRANLETTLGNKGEGDLKDYQINRALFKDYFDQFHLYFIEFLEEKNIDLKKVSSMEELDTLIDYFSNPLLSQKGSQNQKQYADACIKLLSKVSGNAPKSPLKISKIASDFSKITQDFWKKKGIQRRLSYIMDPSQYPKAPQNWYALKWEELHWPIRALGFECEVYTGPSNSFFIRCHGDFPKDTPQVTHTKFKRLKLCNRTQNHWEFECASEGIAKRHNDSFHKWSSQNDVFDDPSFLAEQVTQYLTPQQNTSLTLNKAVQKAIDSVCAQKTTLENFQHPSSSISTLLNQMSTALSEKHLEKVIKWSQKNKLYKLHQTREHLNTLLFQANVHIQKDRHQNSTSTSTRVYSQLCSAHLRAIRFLAPKNKYEKNFDQFKHLIKIYTKGEKTDALQELEKTLFKTLEQTRKRMLSGKKIKFSFG